MPNVFFKCIDAVQEAIAEIRPQIVLMLGEYGGRAEITVERIAHSLNDSARYQSADNNGVTLQDRPTVPGGPVAYYATLPIRAMVKTMREAGIPYDPQELELHVSLHVEATHQATYYYPIAIQLQMDTDNRNPDNEHREDPVQEQQAWMKQITRHETMEEWGVLKPGQCLIHDRDSKFCPAFQDIIDTAGEKRVPLPPRSPNLNAFAERRVRSAKSEVF